jgi:hypothetical protein
VTDSPEPLEPATGRIRELSRLPWFRLGALALFAGVFASAYLAAYVDLTGTETAQGLMNPLRRHWGDAEVAAIVDTFFLGVTLFALARLALERAPAALSCLTKLARF